MPAKARAEARDHPWPNYMTRFTSQELEAAALRLIDGSRPFTWAFWYREARKKALSRLGHDALPPVPPVKRIPPASPTPRRRRRSPLEIATDALLSGRPDEALRAAEAVLASRSSADADLAAEIVVRAFIAHADGLDSLRIDLAQAKRHLSALGQSAEHRIPVGGHLQRIAELQVRLDDGSNASLVSAAAALRRAPFRRSDLAMEAASVVIDRAPRDGAARTTRGAALRDLNRLDEAEEDLLTAWDLVPGKETAVALAALYLRADLTTKALDWATEAIVLAPDDPVAMRTFLAASIAAGEPVGLGAFPEEGDETAAPPPWVTVKAAAALADAGQADLARGALERLLEVAPDYYPAQQALENLR